MSNFSNAQRKHDNTMPDDEEYPETMDCIKCGESVSLEDTGYKYNVELTGTCTNCNAYCKFDLNDF